MTRAEAANITSIGTTFKESNIRTFPELQYFIGLKKIETEAFFWSNNNTCKFRGVLKLPEGLTTIGERCFQIMHGSSNKDCYDSMQIDFPSTITNFTSEMIFYTDGYGNGWNTKYPIYTKIYFRMPIPPANLWVAGTALPPNYNQVTRIIYIPMASAEAYLSKEWVQNAISMQWIVSATL